MSLYTKNKELGQSPVIQEEAVMRLREEGYGRQPNRSEPNTESKHRTREVEQPKRRALPMTFPRRYHGQNQQKDYNYYDIRNFKLAWMA